MEFFKSKLSNVDGAGDIGDYLLAIIKEKVPASQASINTGNSPLAEPTAPDIIPQEKEDQAKN